jgi:glycosyltransferase involved in cell wall biosynthesis
LINGKTATPNGVAPPFLRPARLSMCMTTAPIEAVPTATPAEAQAVGVPTVALRAGGYLDSTVEGVIGVFIDGSSPELIVAGIRELCSRDRDSEAIKIAGRYSRNAFIHRIRRVVYGVLEPATDPSPTGTITKLGAAQHHDFAADVPHDDILTA